VQPLPRPPRDDRPGRKGLIGRTAVSSPPIPASTGSLPALAELRRKKLLAKSLSVSIAPPDLEVLVRGTQTPRSTSVVPDSGCQFFSLMHTSSPDSFFQHHYLHNSPLRCPDDLTPSHSPRHTHMRANTPSSRGRNYSCRRSYHPQSAQAPAEHYHHHTPLAPRALPSPSPSIPLPNPPPTHIRLNPPFQPLPRMAIP
jgi:hypothetical protein